MVYDGYSDFIMEIDRDGAYRRYAESIGKRTEGMTVTEKNIALAYSVMMSGFRMLLDSVVHMGEISNDDKEVE